MGFGCSGVGILPTSPEVDQGFFLVIVSDNPRCVGHCWQGGRSSI